MQDNKEHHFIVAWTPTELVFIEDFSKIDADATWAVLSDTPLHLLDNFRPLTTALASKAEVVVYSFTGNPGVSKTDVANEFTKNFGGITDSIQEYGRCLFDNSTGDAA